MAAWSGLSVKARLWAAVSLWVVGGGGVALLAMQGHPMFLVGVAVLFFTLGLYSSNLRCPRCRCVVAKRQPHLRMTVRSGWPPSHCPQCRLSTRSGWRVNHRGMAKA